MIIQVITRQIGKDTSVERQAADTIFDERILNDFHKSLLATGFHHRSHQIMKGDRVRRRMISRDCFAIDIIANGREQSYFMPHLPDSFSAADIQKYAPAGYVLYAKDFSGKTKAEVQQMIARYQ